MPEPAAALSARCRLAALPALVLWATAGAAATGPIDPGEALRLSQAAIGRGVGEHRFTDQAGQPLQLSALRGRPVIVSYVYTSCGFICPTLTASLAAVVKVARETLGPDSFAVITVGFDTRVDTPEQMRRYAAERGIAEAGWYFVSADQATVDALAAEIGFAYAPAAGGFDHLTQLTILDGAGRVYQQVYGPEFQPPMIVDPLKKLALGTTLNERPLADFLARVRLICTSYDPKSGRYRFDYSLILEIAIGLTCALAVFGFVLHAWRHGPASPAPRP